MALLAHAGQPVAPHDLVWAWSLDVPVVVLLAVAVAVYARGGHVLRALPAGRAALPPWRTWCFVAALAVVAAATLSPLDALAEALFGAHMLQHLLLVLVVPPLLVVSRPLLVAAMALGGDSRRAVTAARSRLLPAGDRSVPLAVTAVVVHAATLWMWHAPPLYEVALEHDALHAVEHATLVAGAVPLWWLVADARGRNANAASVLAVFAAVVQSSALAGLLSFSDAAWYGAHADAATRWGLTALQDQHLAGGLMWFPGAVAYVLGGAFVFLRWLRTDERRGAWGGTWGGT